MIDGFSFPMKSPRSDRVADDPGPDNDFDPVINTVRNLIKEEGALPTGHKDPVRVDAPPPLKKQRKAVKEGKILIWVRSSIQFLIQSITAFVRRPDATRLLAMLMLCTIVVLMPWFVLSFTLLAVLIALITYFSLGPDKVGALVAAWYARLHRRDPNKAEDTRRRAALWSKRISAVMVRLPEKWRTGFYLPEFEEARELPEKMNTDPFDRLDAR